LISSVDRRHLLYAAPPPQIFLILDLTLPHG
jgi:hypothetical protein